MRIRFFLPNSAPLLFALLPSCTPPAAVPAQPQAAPQSVALKPAATPLALTTPAKVNTAQILNVSGQLLPPLPQPVTSFGATATESHYYILGGYFGPPHDYSAEGQSTTLWELEKKNPIGWKSTAELTHGLQGLALFLKGSEVCYAGGNQITSHRPEPARLLSQSQAACFDPSKKTWTDLPPLPRGRSSHEAAVIGSTVYLAGGWQLGDGVNGGSSRGGKWHTDILTLDLNTPGARWQSIAAPFKQRAVGVAATGSNLVVLGGLSDDGKASPLVHVYNTETRTWSRGPNLPSNGFGVAAMGLAGSILASTRDGAVWRWTPGQAAWVAETPLLFPRFFHRLLPSTEGGAIAVGGITGMQRAGRTKHVEKLGLGAPFELSSWTAPFPGTTKNRQAVFLTGDNLYFFGGNNSLGQHDFGEKNFQSEGWAVHLPSMNWRKAPAYPTRRQTMQTLNLDGKLLSVAGFGFTSNGAATQADAYTFDLKTETWSPTHSLPQSRTQFGLAQNDDRLWIFGGLNFDPTRPGMKKFEHLTDILRAPADLSSPFSAVKGFTMPDERRAFAGAVLDGKYYMIGGMKAGFKLVTDCLSADLTLPAPKMSSISCPKRNRLSAQLVALNGKLYISGGSSKGSDGLEPERSVEVFDPATKEWSTLIDDVGFNPKHMRAFPYRENILLVSTHMESAEIRFVLIRPPGSTSARDTSQSAAQR